MLFAAGWQTLWSLSMLQPDELHYALLKTYILRRDYWRCRAYGSRNDLQVHHVIFRSQGGPSESWNLATVCFGCHEAIHQHKIRVVGDNADIQGELLSAMKFLRIPK